MGNKEKKKNKYRSRSRDRSRSREHKKRKKEKRRPSSSEESSDESDASRSRSSRHKKSSKHKSHKHDRRKHSQSPDRKKSKRAEPIDPEKRKEEIRQEKELIKALETPEEKRARRMAKKELKERKRKEEMGWDKDYVGYSNADNPFGDEHLMDTFVWNKKLDKEGKKDMNVVDLQRHNKIKMGENRRELEKVKKRRQEREKQMEERDQEREQLQREKEAEYYRTWELQEDSFHLNQAKMRSQIRIQDGRAKPIDLLAKYISAEDDKLAIEMHEPYTYLYGLTITDLEDLLEDIKVYLELEQGKNADYWRDIITVSQDELNKLRKLDTTSREYFGDRRDGINQAVTTEVADVFKGKSTNQLKLLETQIKSKLEGGEGIDIGYWESLLQQLKAHMARTRLRERHQDVLRQKLHELKREQGIEPTPLFPVKTEDGENNISTSSPGDTTTSRTIDQVDIKQEEQPSTSGTTEAQQTEEGKDNSDDDDDSEEEIITEADIEQGFIDEYEAGGYSPKLMQPSNLDIDAVVYDPVDDLKKLELARSQVQSTGRVRLDGETEFEKKAREGMNDDEATFSVEVALDSQAFLWSDKYRPRKPRFFNRVHTGFEWNKYNQTHYDIDNPPPKIVQGYKFNIFYPDLIEKSKTPEYTVTPCENEKDFAILRFRASAPYEDIAFKVVNREWEYSYKRGFRCQFTNNIFQLWFHFKRFRYRR
ncbi:splicing factor Cactin isoform X2 [Patella vulgata]|uniref:splicing factor Cactin isoform X2 n=1 Tax=Patella vulgata TaxID=6465 RepID=UPI0024A93D5E|nr:splicing factor Cactin isoform X2 [Patella vulgata]